MVEKEDMWQLLRHSRADTVVVLATLGLVVFRDLIEGIVVGFALAGLVFIHRMSENSGAKGAADTDLSDEAGVAVYHVSGPWFFGTAARLGTLLDAASQAPRALVIDLADVPYIDSSGANAVALLARNMARRGTVLMIAAARPDLRAVLARAGVTEPLVRFMTSLADLPAERINRVAHTH